MKAYQSDSSSVSENTSASESPKKTKKSIEKSKSAREVKRPKLNGSGEFKKLESITYLNSGDRIDVESLEGSCGSGIEEINEKEERKEKRKEKKEKEERRRKEKELKENKQRKEEEEDRDRELEENIEKKERKEKKEKRTKIKNEDQVKIKESINEFNFEEKKVKLKRSTSHHNMRKKSLEIDVLIKQTGKLKLSRSQEDFEELKLSKIGTIKEDLTSESFEGEKRKTKKTKISTREHKEIQTPILIKIPSKDEQERYLERKESFDSIEIQRESPDEDHRKPLSSSPILSPHE